MEGRATETNKNIELAFIIKINKLMQNIIKANRA